MIRTAWRRFGDYRAERQIRKDPNAQNIYESVQHAIRNEIPIASRRWRHEPDLSYIRPHVTDAQNSANDLEHSTALSGAKAWAWLRALVLQAPQAALAQQQMDKHPHGYRSKGDRLYELIDFNDAFVSTVLALPADEMAHFSEEAWRLMTWFCKRVGVRCFSTEQYWAIVRGLGREIAVYRTAIGVGYRVKMTSRREDALGIDMVITDPSSERSVNVDCKAASAYRHRIYDLLREGRLSEDDIRIAEEQGFIGVMNGRGSEKTLVVIWRIDVDRYGEVRNFSFENGDMIAKTITEIVDHYGR